MYVDIRVKRRLIGSKYEIKAKPDHCISSQVYNKDGGLAGDEGKNVAGCFWTEEAIETKKEAKI